MAVRQADGRGEMPESAQDGTRRLLRSSKRQRRTRQIIYKYIFDAVERGADQAATTLNVTAYRRLRSILGLYPCTPLAGHAEFAAAYYTCADLNRPIYASWHCSTVR
jgi:hypothetical protein